jgi:hypothetical protein
VELLKGEIYYEKNYIHIHSRSDGLLNERSGIRERILYVDELDWN